MTSEWQCCFFLIALMDGFSAQVIAFILYYLD